MKNFLTGAALLSLTLLSCTNDPAGNLSNEPTPTGTTFANKLSGSEAATDPANAANPYDLAGAAQNELFDLYLSGNYSAASLEAVSSQIAILASQHRELADLHTEASVSQEQLAYIINNPAAALDSIGTTPSLSATATAGFSSFMASLIEGQDSDYEQLYLLITAYESTVLESPAYNAQDREVILTATSLARYSVYYKKKRKDRDWDTSVGNVIAGANGAQENTISAVTMAVITGISINNGITD